MRRRYFLSSGVVAAASLGCPALLRAQVPSGTPVINGKRVRRRLSSLSDDDPFFAAYSRAIALMHQQPETSPLSWIAQAHTHADFCEHETIVEFLPWHRPYLVLFERICASLIEDPAFALPYWDWGDNNGRLPQPFYNAGPLSVLSWNDDGNYLGQRWGPISTIPYRFARADFGMADDPRFAGSFTPDSLGRIVQAKDYTLLSGLIDSPHGSTHVFTGGIRRFNLGTDDGHFSSGLSPLDPCFWLHHANVDRIWAQSPIPIDQQKAAVDPAKAYHGIFFDENASPVSPVLGELFDLTAQDYTYDFLIPDLMTEKERAIQAQILEAQPRLREFAQLQGLTAIDTTPPEVIARGEPTGETVIGAINRIDFSTDDVGALLTTERLVRRPLADTPDAVAIDTGRVYARFKDVKPQLASKGNLVNVFVDCPYLSEATPTTDPHFAGVLSFFGCNPEVCGSREFVVEITAPLRYLLATGALTPSEIQLQLLTLNGSPGPGTPVAQHGEVELIAG